MRASEISTAESSSRHPGQRPVRVLIYAASSVVRAGLEHLLELEAGIEVVGSTAKMPELSSFISRHKPDVALIDLEDTRSLSGELKSFLRQKIPAVLLGQHISPELLSAALSHGAKGVVQSNTAGRKLAMVLQAAAAGVLAIPDDLAEVLAEWLPRPAIHDYAADYDQGVTGNFTEALTARELEVLEMMMEGLSNKEIAMQLNVSTHTVKFHISSILGKLGAATRTQAITIGLRRGLITI